MRSGITVLMYHRILEDADCVAYPFTSLVMPRSLFEAQLAYLSAHTRVLRVFDALAQLGAPPLDSKPLVCLTFDDGYSDNFEIAAPLLESHGLRGTFFITAGAVQAQKALWYDQAADFWERLGAQALRELLDRAGEAQGAQLRDRSSWIEWLKTLPNDQRTAIISTLEASVTDSGPSCSLMTLAQVRQLADRGHEIGSHTLWHPVLTTMTEQQRREEIHGAKRLLEEWTQRDVPGFCYPNGDFDAAVALQLREAGHEYACTTLPGRNHVDADRFGLRRIDMTSGRVSSADGHFDEPGFRAEISMLHEALRSWSRPQRGQGA